MNPDDARIKLAAFVESLPEKVFSFLLDKKLEPNILPIDIATAQGFVLKETGSICEGVRRVLAGEDSPVNLVAFISQDKNIEEDNRAKIPKIAEEIQKQIFDPVLPILKQAGMPVKEGKVAPAPSPISPIRPIGQIRPSGPMGAAPTTPSRLAVGTPLLGQEGRGKEMDERHLRALLRIAAGTTYTEEKLREAFEDLPEGLRRAIVSVDTANAVQEIAKKYLLHIDQMGALASETGLVLLGLTHPRDFVRNLTTRLRVSEGRALEIARDISGQILSKVREVLRGLHEKPTTDNRQPTTEKAEPVRKLSVVPSSDSSFAKGGAEGGGFKIPRPADGTLPLGKGELSRAQTPFSAQWKTEEETPSREEVLRGIEQPAKKLPATSYQLPASPVGPTGWRKPVAEEATAPPPRPPAPPPAPAVPTPPQQQPPAPSSDFLEQKLSGPMGSKPETRRYTIDPYREPTQ